MDTNIPRPTFEQVIRPALAFVFIMIFWATYPHNTSAEAQPYTGPITVRTYAFPQHERDAADACVVIQRESRDIPRERNAYISWWNANEGTESQQDWSAAFRECQEDHLWQNGKWNWGNMLLVKEEVSNG